MFTFYYRHLALQDALSCVGQSGQTVWYYVTGEFPPPAWTDSRQVRDDAVSAVVATTSNSFGHGTYMGEIVFLDGKDPIPDPPPPPPPYFDELKSYKEQQDVVAFFAASPRVAAA